MSGGGGGGSHVPANMGLWSSLLKWSLAQENTVGSGEEESAAGGASPSQRSDDLQWLKEAFSSAHVRSDGENLRLVADFLRGASFALSASLDATLLDASRKQIQESQESDHAQSPPPLSDEVKEALARLPAEGVREKQDVALEMLTDLCEVQENANDYLTIPEAPQRLLSLCDVARPAVEEGGESVPTPETTRCLALDAIATSCQNNPKAARGYLLAADAPKRLAQLISVNVATATQQEEEVRAKLLLAAGALARADAACLTRFVAADGVGATTRLLPTVGAGSTAATVAPLPRLRMWRKALALVHDVLDALCSDENVDNARQNAASAVELGLLVRVTCVLDDLHARACGRGVASDDDEVARACTAQVLEAALRLLMGTWAKHDDVRAAMVNESGLREALTRWRDALQTGGEAAAVPEGLVASLGSAAAATLAMIES